MGRGSWRGILRHVGQWGALVAAFLVLAAAVLKILIEATGMMMKRVKD